jgi:hypothetical protein
VRWVPRREKPNIGNEKDDAVDGLSVGAKKFDEQSPAGPISSIGCGMRRLKAA